MGNAMFIAAKANSPSVWPMKIPSIIEYTDMANILTIPGSATVKNSFHGFIVANICLESNCII
jgi:hypothetical protein